MNKPRSEASPLQDTSPGHPILQADKPLNLGTKIRSGRFVRVFFVRISRLRMANLLYKFGQITSIKGIPRLLRTKSVFMRFIWSVSVIGFLCMALFQAMLLTREYFQYKTYTSTGEVMIDYFGENNGSSAMPDITLCNANPFASNRSLGKDVPTIEEYFRLAKKSLVCDSTCTEEENEALKNIRDEIMTTRGYFNYIGRHNAQQLGHNRESFIADCNLNKEGVGMFIQRVPCLANTQIIEIQYTLLYNCYTIRLPQNEFPDKMYGGFLVVLHLDDYDAAHNEQPQLTPHEEPGQMSGVWFFAHQRNQPLMTYTSRMMLQPGQFHDIPLKTEIRTHLPPPHGHCQNVEEEKYSMMQCYAACIQRRIYQQCGCLDLQNYTSQWEPTDMMGPSCLSISLGKDDLLKNWNCASNERMIGLSECGASCPKPCQERRYNLRSSQMTWPAHSVHQNFYDLYIANRSYEEHYRTLFEDPGSNQELFNKVSKHFLVVHTYLETITALDISDRPQFTGISFMSQLGGALNLWAGITVVVLIELIEFCYEVLAHWFTRRSPEKKHTSTEKHEQELEKLRDNAEERI